MPGANKEADEMGQRTQSEPCGRAEAEWTLPRPALRREEPGRTAWDEGGEGAEGAGALGRAAAGGRWSREARVHCPREGAMFPPPRHSQMAARQPGLGRRKPRGVEGQPGGGDRGPPGPQDRSR